MSGRNENSHLHNHKQGEHKQRDLTNTHLNNIKNNLTDGTQKTLLVGSNDINGGTPHRHLTVDANGRLLTIPLMTTTNNKLTDIVNNTAKNSVSASHSLSIAGGATEETAVIDLGADTSSHKLQFAGTTSHNNIDVVLKVSNDNITFYDFTEPIFTVGSLKISGSIDLTFRYYKLAITDNTGSPITVNLIESGKSL